MRRTPHPRGDFAHPLNISDILSVCHDRQDLLPGILARLRELHRYGDLPPWSYIRLRDSNLKFYIEGRFVGRYDRRRQLPGSSFCSATPRRRSPANSSSAWPCRRRRYSRGFSTSATTEWSSTSAGSPTWDFRRATARSAPKISSGSCIPKTEAGWPTPSQNNSQES